MTTQYYSPENLSCEDYARAESLLPHNLSSKNVFGTSATPIIIAGTNRFWYRASLREGGRFISSTQRRVLANRFLIMLQWLNN